MVRIISTAVINYNPRLLPGVYYSPDGIAKPKGLTQTHTSYDEDKEVRRLRVAVYKARVNNNQPIFGDK